MGAALWSFGTVAALSATLSGSQVLKSGLGGGVGWGTCCRVRCIKYEGCSMFFCWRPRHRRQLQCSGHER